MRLDGDGFGDDVELCGSNMALAIRECCLRIGIRAVRVAVVSQTLCVVGILEE